MTLNEPNTIYLVGAYGRRATKEDWEAGKDFRILNGHSGMYCSNRDKEQMKKDGFKQIKIIWISSRWFDVTVVHEEQL